MRLAQRASLLVAFSLLASAGCTPTVTPARTYNAECAWVLWLRHEHWVSNDIESRDEGFWERRSVYATRSDCVARMAEESRSIPGTYWICSLATYGPGGGPNCWFLKDGAVPILRCLPDKDPCGPKGK